MLALELRDRVTERYLKRLVIGDWWLVDGYWTSLCAVNKNSSLHLDEFLLQAFRLEVRYQRVDEGSQFAVHHFGELVQREADAMVGDAVLREIVGANFLGAVARLDLAQALGGDGFVLLVTARVRKGARATRAWPWRDF